MLTFSRTAIVASVALLTSTSAFASSSINFALEATVPASCVAIKNSPLTVHVIDLTTTADQSLGSITYQCNNPAGFTRTISSAEGSKLKRVGGTQTVDYTVKHGGGSGLAISTPTSLATPFNSSHNGSPAFVAGQTGSFSVQLPTVPSNLFAGTYTDIVTVTIVGN